MNFLISLPNPNEGTVQEFFTQTRIALKACEKSYQEMTKHLTEEEKSEESDTPYILFKYPDLEDVLDEIDPDNERRQNVQLEITQL